MKWLCPLTAEQRAAALEKAAAARRERAEVKHRLKYTGGSLEEVIKEGQENEVLGKMKVSALLESLPNVGKVEREADHGGDRDLGVAARAWPRRPPDRRPRRAVRVHGRSAS